MKLIKKNGAKVYQVADSSWFAQYANEVVSDADDNGAVYDFIQESVKGTDIEDDYEAWTKDHFADYYFAVVVSKFGDFYAVAYERYEVAAYAVEIENPSKD